MHAGGSVNVSHMCDVDLRFPRNTFACVCVCLYDGNIIFIYMSQPVGSSHSQSQSQSHLRVEDDAL